MSRHAAWLAIALSSATSLSLGAQGRDTIRILPIQDVVAIALVSSPRVQRDAQELLHWRGVRLQAAAPFDPQLSTALSRQRVNTLTPSASSALELANVVSDRVVYSTTLEKQFRSGFSIIPELSVAQSWLTGIAGAPTNTGSASLRLVVPLLNNRGGSVLAAAERVADLDYAGNLQDLRHSATVSVYESVVAYWEYLAASHRLDALREAQARARRLVDETEQLVRADERPASDVKQLRANLAAKTAACITAEQQLAEARAQLGLTIGLSGDKIDALPDATTEFPSPPDTTGLTPATIRRLEADAIARRADLRGANDKQRASQIELDAAVRNLRPRLDLDVGIGYEGFAQQWGVDGFFAPLRRNLTGAIGSFALSYQLPTRNVNARGRVMQLEAFLEQQRIGVSEVARNVVTDVALASQAVERGILGLRECEAAVALFRETVDNEKRKFQLGTSTLFDVIAAEDGLTNAILAEVAARRAYAVGVIRLRYATGTLLDTDARGLVVRPDIVLTLP